MTEYICDSGHIFEEPKVHIERHGFTWGPGERETTCPVCGSDSFEPSTDIARWLEGEITAELGLDGDYVAVTYLSDKEAFIAEILDDSGDVERVRIYNTELKRVYDV